ncbi:MAG: asparagine--tRNA ligase [Thermoplasmata archaeon]|nr:asparagine--tRNA ligase [Thermoplasmata archaeon]
MRAQMAGVPIAPARFDPVARVFAPDAIGTKVHLRGWLQRSRSSGGILFLMVRDRTGLVQATAKKDVIGEERFAGAEHVQIEGSLRLAGTVAEDRRAPGGREVRIEEIEVIDPGLPFPIFQDQTEEFLLDKRHLAIRSVDHVATFRVKAELLRSLRQFLEAEEVLEVTPPIITGNPAEGGSEAFVFDYFGRQGYLSQSAQLYLEALLFPHERVYAVTPSFRAEKSRTTRHITEFTHLEVELAWCDLDGLMEFTERMLVSSLHEVATRRPRELEALGRPPAELLALNAPFPRLRYSEAIERLQKVGFPVSWGSDLGTAEERALTLEERSPIFLTHFPRELKAFYMLRSSPDERTVEAADLLAPEGYGEIVGESARETKVELLVERLRAIGADPAEYDWYLDTRRHGSIPHAGLGLGVERILRWVLRREHIRETTPFPRTPSRHTP